MYSCKAGLWFCSLCYQKNKDHLHNGDSNHQVLGWDHCIAEGDIPLANNQSLHTVIKRGNEKNKNFESKNLFVFKYVVKLKVKQLIVSENEKNRSLHAKVVSYKRTT